MICLCQAPISAVSSERRRTTEASQAPWAGRLRPRAPPAPALPAGPSRRLRRPESEELLRLRSAARFLRREAPEGVARTVVTRAADTPWVYIAGDTLHVHTPYYLWPSDLSIIRLVTHLRLVGEVRIHTFHLSHYHTARTVFVNITASPWVAVKSVLDHISRGPRVLRGRRVERAVRVTFDDFLYPVIEAWRAKRPYVRLIQRLPKLESARISTVYHLPNVSIGLNLLARGFATDSDREVDIEGSDDEEDGFIGL